MTDEQYYRKWSMNSAQLEIFHEKSSYSNLFLRAIYNDFNIIYK